MNAARRIYEGVHMMRRAVNIVSCHHYTLDTNLSSLSHRLGALHHIGIAPTNGVSPQISRWDVVISLSEQI